MQKETFVRRVLTGLFGRSNQADTPSGLDRLTRLVRRFSVEQQQVPRDLKELVELKYIACIPSAPAGKRFVIDRRKVEVRLETMDAERRASASRAESELQSSIGSKPTEDPA